MTVMGAKVRVVLRIDPFLLCSAVQIFLAENHHLEVVIADQDLNPSAVAVQALPQRTVQVVLREGWLNFEVSQAGQKEYCQDLATLAEQLNTIAANAVLGDSAETPTK